MFFATTAFLIAAFSPQGVDTNKLGGKAIVADAPEIGEEAEAPPAAVPHEITSSPVPRAERPPMRLPQPVGIIIGPTAGLNPWWLDFENERLRGLIEEALEKRSDLKAAVLQAQQKGVLSTGALAPILPQVGVDVTGAGIAFEALEFQSSGFTRSTPSLGPLPIAAQIPGFAKDAPPLIYYTGSAYLTGGLRVDAGKTFMNYLSLSDEASASLDDSDTIAAQIALTVAMSYFDLLAAHEQINIVEAQIAANKSVLETVKNRYDVGAAPKLELLQQQQQLASAESQLPAARL